MPAGLSLAHAAADVVDDEGARADGDPGEHDPGRDAFLARREVEVHHCGRGAVRRKRRRERSDGWGIVCN